MKIVPLTEGTKLTPSGYILFHSRRWSSQPDLPDLAIHLYTATSSGNLVSIDRCTTLMVEPVSTNAIVNTSSMSIGRYRLPFVSISNWIGSSTGPYDSQAAESWTSAAASSSSPFCGRGEACCPVSVKLDPDCSDSSGDGCETVVPFGGNLGSRFDHVETFPIPYVSPHLALGVRTDR